LLTRKFSIAFAEERPPTLRRVHRKSEFGMESQTLKEAEAQYPNEVFRRTLPGTQHFST